jgi:hypothetical protein
MDIKKVKGRKEEGERYSNIDGIHHEEWCWGYGKRRG